MRVMADEGHTVDGRYLLEERIGSGGMGVVWRGHDTKLDRPVALKCARLDDDRAAKRMRAEARNAARLHHPHIVAVFDCVDDRDGCWLVMEYVPSRSLAQIMAAGGPLRPERAAAIGWQIADALAAAHAKGVVHGDVTPENILVTEEGVAKLADFGISRALWADVTHSAAAVAPGKPRYIAPEVARGVPAGRESDRFSLGATLFAAVEGHSPYGEADSPMAYLGRAMQGHIEEPRHAGQLTEPLTALLRRDPGTRPSAAETRRLLEEVAPPSDEVLRLHGDTGWRTPLPLSLWRPRRRALLGAAGVALAAAAVAAALLVPGIAGGSGGSGGSAGAADPRHPVRPAAAGGLGDDPSAADPCALIATTPLDRFGDTELTTDYGNFDRCDVVVTGKGSGSQADVAVTFLGTDVEQGSQVPTTRVGDLTIAREPLSGDECDRTLKLPDGNYAQIMARRTDETSPDLCAMADAATDHAVAVLRRGPVPARAAAPDAGSLARLDACSLLSPAALSRIPGIDAAHPEADFGNWGCRWESTVNDTDVRLVFDRSGAPLDTSDGQPTQLSGRQGLIAPEWDDPGTCTAIIVNRVFTDIAGHRTDELVELTVAGSGKVGQLCDTAQQLGVFAAAKLPTA